MASTLEGSFLDFPLDQLYLEEVHVLHVLAGSLHCFEGCFFVMAPYVHLYLLSIHCWSFFSSLFRHGLTAASNRSPLSTQICTTRAFCLLDSLLFTSRGRTLAHRWSALLILFWTSTLGFILWGINRINDIHRMETVSQGETDYFPKHAED